MRIEELRTLLEFNYWANERLREFAGKVPVEELMRARGMNYESLLGTLVHILDAEWSWRVGCETGTWPNEDLTVQTIPDLAALRARCDEEAAGMRSFLSSLADADADSARTFR